MHGNSIHDLYRQSRQAAVWGFAISLLLGLAKLAGGWFGHSVALLVDAVHSFGDALLSGVVWGALLWSQQPADPEHPYGHTRAETVAGSSISLLLLLSALVAAWQSLLALAEPPLESPTPLTLAVAGASFLVNEWLYRRNSRVARHTGSAALQATSWDQRLDALTALAILGALLLVRYAGPAWHLADPLAGLGVALVILVVSGRLFWSSLNELMDAQAAPEIIEDVRREALTVAGVLGIEKVRVRKSGLEYLVDIHVEVDPDATVREGHAIGHAVKDHLVVRIASIKDVLVHIEPAPEVRAGSHKSTNHETNQ
jgi:cation diffusion facilitator family transporter